MFASFHAKGTIPSCSDMLNTCASGVQICSTVSFSILGAMLILLANNYRVTTNCTNLSPSDSLNFGSGTGNELVSSLVNTELKCIIM